MSESKEKIPVKNLMQRMRDVMLDVKYILKEDKKVNGQYTFVSHDAVAKALHDPLAKHGVMMIPSVNELKQEGNRTVVKVCITFVNVDDPEQQIMTYHYGYGIDQQDKGPGKAISYAVKYCMLKTFCLETGDDPERDNIDFKPEFINQEQIETLKNLCIDPSWQTKLLVYLGVNQFSEILSSRYVECINILKTKAKQLEKE